MRTIYALEERRPARRGFLAAAIASALGRAVSLLQTIRASLRAIAGHRQLQSLSDWQLRDIGLKRSDILFRDHIRSVSSTRKDHAEH